jgi:hypothetical protein
MSIAIENNGGFDFEIDKEELIPLKGKSIIPMFIQE